MPLNHIIRDHVHLNCKPPGQGDLDNNKFDTATPNYKYEDDDYDDEDYAYGLPKKNEEDDLNRYEQINKNRSNSGTLWLGIFIGEFAFVSILFTHDFVFPDVSGALITISLGVIVYFVYMRVPRRRGSVGEPMVTYSPNGDEQGSNTEETEA